MNTIWIIIGTVLLLIYLAIGIKMAKEELDDISYEEKKEVLPFLGDVLTLPGVLFFFFVVDLATTGYHLTIDRFQKGG